MIQIINKLQLSLIVSNLVDFIQELGQIFEIIHPEYLFEKIKNKKNITVYFGVEVNNKAHIGHELLLRILLILSKYSNVKAILLLADYHTILQNKEVNSEYLDSILNFIKINNLEHNIQFVANGTYFKNDKRVSEINYFMNASYQNYLNNIFKTLKVKHLKKASTFFNRHSPEDCILSEINYICNQIADIQYLNIDLAIGGTDQRRLHMVHNDYVRKITYVHIPLLRWSADQKISKSIPESIIPIDIAQNLKLEKLKNFKDYDKYLEFINFFNKYYS